MTGSPGPKEIGSRPSLTLLSCPALAQAKQSSTAYLEGALTSADKAVDGDTGALKERLTFVRLLGNDGMRVVLTFFPKKSLLNEFDSFPTSHTSLKTHVVCAECRGCSAFKLLKLVKWLFRGLSRHFRTAHPEFQLRMDAFVKVREFWVTGFS